MFSRKETIDRQYLKISREHQIVKDYILKFQNILFEEKSNTMKLLRNAFKHFEEDMISHFRLEEIFIFPTALLCIPDITTADLVLKLQKEHGYFERDLKAILQMIEDTPKPVKEIPDPIKKVIGSFSTSFIHHAENEMNVLYPEIDNNKRANEIIDGFVK